MHPSIKMNLVIRGYLQTLVTESKRVETLIKMSDAGTNVGAAIENAILNLSSIIDGIKKEQEKDTRKPHYCSGIVVLERGQHRIICDNADSPRCASQNPNLKIEMEIEHNVSAILATCYDAFFDLPNPRKTRKIIGDLNSPTWHSFTEKVIAHLKKNGCFDPHPSGYIDTFEDTAGGCDEITWDAACEIIEKSDA